MSEDASIPLLNHELAADELAWMQAVYADFSSTRAAFSDPKEALRAVLGRDEHRLPTPMDLSGPGPWRNGRNRHDRMVTAVFLPKVELHRHWRGKDARGDEGGETGRDDGRSSLSQRTLRMFRILPSGRAIKAAPKLSIAPIFAAPWITGSVKASPATKRATVKPIPAITPATRRSFFDMPAGSGKPSNLRESPECKNPDALACQERDEDQPCRRSDCRKFDACIGKTEHEEPEVDDHLPLVLVLCKGRPVFYVLLEEVFVLPQAHEAGKE